MRFDLGVHSRLGIPRNAIDICREEFGKTNWQRWNSDGSQWGLNSDLSSLPKGLKLRFRSSYPLVDPWILLGSEKAFERTVLGEERLKWRCRLPDFCCFGSAGAVELLNFLGKCYAISADNDAIEASLVSDINEITSENVLGYKSCVENGDLGNSSAPCAAGEGDSVVVI